MLKITFLDRGSLPADLSFDKPRCEHQWEEYDITLPEQVTARAAGSDVIVTSKVVLNRETLQALPQLKLIAVIATGINNIDQQAAGELGIAIKNVPSYSAQSVSEHVMAMIFALRHGLPGWQHDIQRERWASQRQFCYFDHPVRDIAGSALGIIGAGAIGGAVARLASAVGMRVLLAERRGAPICRPGYLPFEQVLQQADILSLHCPLTAETDRMINSETLSLCHPSTLLINTARGGLVDEPALLHALEHGIIGGAALDSLTREPPARENILLQAAKTRANLLITPHIAWSSPSALQTLMSRTIDNIERFAAGQS
ncbi:glycerate dehydrogenase [Affinibrenneria salicis]|uniref:Glycerate dehydrogenase n=1 Tax=Affinibrenneria salicis TaxID=2590031 RepID=A0A5J5FQL3_9GAMM|nr:NAD(P)-dependent oxidoreductase [Affinibrenneria salicis]KAA8995272.1 glycerate dehydrogenase [Affinibrenneria salicis]